MLHKVLSQLGKQQWQWPVGRKGGKLSSWYPLDILLLIEWHYLPNATCLIRPHLFSTASHCLIRLLEFAVFFVTFEQSTRVHPLAHAARAPRQQHARWPPAAPRRSRAWLPRLLCLRLCIKPWLPSAEKIIARQATNTIQFDKPGPSAIFQRGSGVLMEVAC